MLGTPSEIIKYLYQQPQDDIFEIKKKKNKRSLNANGYAWKLCSEIANVLNITKEEVYKKVIKETGEFEVVPIKKEAVEMFVRGWTSKGIGWICDVESSKLKGYVNVVIYYGSSIYDTKQMSRLIDSLVQEAKMLGIVTLDELEIERLLEKYEKGI